MTEGAVLPLCKILHKNPYKRQRERRMFSMLVNQMYRMCYQYNFDVKV